MSEYDKIEEKIRNTMIKAYDFQKGLQLCKRYLKLLSKDKNRNKLTNRFWMATYNLAYNYKILKEYSKAIKYFIKSIEYTKKDQYDINYSKSLSMLGNCYEEIGIKDEAKKIHYKCLKIYELTNNTFYKYLTLFNIYKIEKDVQLMENTKINFENSLIDDNICNKKEQKINILHEMEIEINDIINTYEAI